MRGLEFPGRDQRPTHASDPRFPDDKVQDSSLTAHGRRRSASNGVSARQETGVGPNGDDEFVTATSLRTRVVAGEASDMIEDPAIMNIRNMEK